MNAIANSEPDIVHSSAGRLRVHCPEADARLPVRLRLLPGVSFAEINSWSRNILILFDPSQTTEEALLQAVRGPVPMETDTDGIVEVSGTELEQQRPAIGYVTGLRGRIYKILGWASLGMGAVGAALPGIPTVPFVLLGGYFFVRSSPRTHEWLLRSRYFGGILRDWEERRGVSQSVKWTGLGLIAIGMVLTVLANLPLELAALILAVEIIGMIIVARLRVVEPAH